MKNFTTLVTIIVFVLVLSVIVYFKSQSTYYKTAYELTNKEFTEYKADQRANLAIIESQNKIITNNYKTLVDKAEADARYHQEIVNNTTIINDKLLSSLREQIRNSNTKLPNLTPETATKYALTYSKIFEECAAEVVYLADRADGHAIDAKKLYDSFPEDRVENNADK